MISVNCAYSDESVSLFRAKAASSDRIEVGFQGQERVEPLQEKDPGAGGMVEHEARPDSLDDVVALDAVHAEAVDQAGQSGPSYYGAAVEAKRLAKGFIDPTLPPDVGERVSDGRNGRLASVDFYGLADEPPLGRGVGERIETMSHDPAEKRNKSIFAPVDIEDFGKPVGQKLEFVKARGRNLKKGLQVVWFLRNSWSPGWGEGGYMRIPYGCSYVGYGAALVDYAGGASFVADTSVGWVPFEVGFTGYSTMDIESWSWAFGDGGSAFVQSPVHIYEEPGCYDVSLEVATTGGDTLIRTRYNCVAALADTLVGDSVYVDPDSVVLIVVRGVNTSPVQEIRIPVVYTGTLELMYDSFSTVGCRTETFEEQALIQFIPSSKKLTLRLKTSENHTHPDLEPGSGDIARLYFHVAGTPSLGAQATIALDGYTSGSGDRLPTFSGLIAEYEVASVSGLAAYSSCCRGVRANIDSDLFDVIDIADLVYLVDYMFTAGAEPDCWYEANVDGDLVGDLQQTVDIADLVYLVDYMFDSGPLPPQCPTY